MGSVKRNMLGKNSRDLQLLFNAIERGDFIQVKDMITNGVDINTTNHLGETILQIAQKFNRGAIAEFLVVNGADITINNFDFTCS